MRLDAHQHFWQYDPREYAWISEAMPQIKRSFLPADLEPLLESNQIDGCIAVQARQTPKENDFLLNLARDQESIAAVVGWIDLQADDILPQLVALRSIPKLKGFRHIVQDEPDEHFLLRPAFINGVKALGTLDYTYDLLIYEKHFPSLVKFLEQFSEQYFVLDHLGKPLMDGAPSQNWIDGIRAVAQYPNLFCKVSGLVTEADWSSWTPEFFYPYLEIVLEAFGADRLMVGSDWPVCLLAADSYQKVMDIPKAYFAGLSTSDQVQIFGKNAQRFYQI